MRRRGWNAWPGEAMSSIVKPGTDPMRSLDRYVPYALAALRIVAALIFIEHGTQKLFGFPAAPQAGLPAAMTLSWFAAVLEVFGGLALLLGIFTRPVAFILSGEMAV